MRGKPTKTVGNAHQFVVMFFRYVAVFAVDYGALVDGEGSVHGHNISVGD